MLHESDRRCVGGAGHNGDVRRPPLGAWVGVAGGLGALGSGFAYLAVTGRLTLDLGWGRVVRPLGPLVVHASAPKQVVFDVVAQPYGERRTRAMAEKLTVLERGDAMVVAEHYTPLAGGLRAVTVEAVRFDRPGQVSFRLLRGPVPFVTETFALEEQGGTTTLEYRGELGTDLGPLGAAWGRMVARRWVRAVRETLEAVVEEAERRSRWTGLPAHGNGPSASGD